MAKFVQHLHNYIVILFSYFLFLEQNTSEYANDFSEAAKERDKTQPSTVERCFVFSVCITRNTDHEYEAMC